MESRTGLSVRTAGKDLNERGYDGEDYTEATSASTTSYCGRGLIERPAQLDLSMKQKDRKTEILCM
jgi:hypothetical protein